MPLVSDPRTLSDMVGGPLSGRRALITAGSSGIGRTIAAALHAQGAVTFITGTSERTQSVAGEVGAVGSARADFTVPGAARGVVEQAAQAMGGIDILIANTGGPKPGPFKDLTDADWLGAYNLMLGSALELTGAALPGMAAAGWGRLIYITSTAGVIKPLPGLHLSNVMRAGVAALAKSIAVEAGASGVTTNVIAPGPTNTGRRQEIMEFKAKRTGVPVEQVAADELKAVPIGRMVEPEEIAALVAFLCSDQAGSTTAAVHVVDGGMTVA